MVLTIKMDTKGLVELRDTLGRYISKLPRAANKDLETVSEDFVFEFRQELLSRLPELYWNSILISSIRTEKIANGFQIPMAIHGILLDKMSPHLAPMWTPSPITGTILGEWALDKFPEEEKIPNVLYVKPHPWMRAPIERARNKILERLEDGEFHKTMEKRGR